MKAKSRDEVSAAEVTRQKFIELFTLSLDDALAGDIPLMRQYLRTAASLIQQGTPVPPKLGLVVAKGLREIADGKDPAKALHLKVGHNRKRSRLRSLRIAYAVHQLVHDGMSAPAAFDLVSRMTGDDELNRLIGPVVGPDAIKKIYTANKKHLPPGP